jgi:two-component system, NtrC family, response regulator HydG
MAIPSILIIDDDLYMVRLLSNFLKKEGYKTHSLTTGKPALKLLSKKEFNLVLCDIRLPDMEGTLLLSQIRQMAPQTIIIMMTAYANINNVVECIKLGAYDYVTKPLIPENISNVIKTALHSKQFTKPVGDFEFITGSCPKIERLIEQAKLVAPTNMSVLIQGETGSGKEYIARMIHQNSERKNKNFIPIDCGAIPKELAASELFGHIKGAFTGAISDKSGYFEHADGGTIFLDEIGNLTYETQVKLLRAIQQKVVTRVGDTKPIPVDVRIISATNSNLTLNAREGDFREDLYHRINEFKIELPPLRDRGDDIILFAEHFLKQANTELNKTVKAFNPVVINAFKTYSWYGNLREMRNVIKRSVLLAKNDIITLDCLPEEIIESKGSFITSQNNSIKEMSLKEAGLQAEKSVIQKALLEANDNKSEAAKILKIDRKTLYNKLKELGLQ